MEYSFKLPPGWQSRRYDADTNLQLYNEMGCEPGYQFYMTANPTVKFCLSVEAIDRYKDEPQGLVMLMKRQIDQYTLASYARAVAEHKKQPVPIPFDGGGPADAPAAPPAPAIRARGECATPYYCHWRRKHNGYIGMCDMCDFQVDPLPYVLKKDKAQK